MKKTILTSILLVVSAIPAMAQDTLSADSLKSSYLCDQWPDFTRDSLLMDMGRMEPTHEKVEGQMFGEDGDTITIYGIAAGVETFEMEIVQSAIWDPISGQIIGLYDDSTYYYRELNSMCDTSAYEEAYELWGLYKRVADTLQQVSPQLPLNIKLDTPTYILTFNSYNDVTYTDHTPPLPVYEMFFHTPQVVSGSFFVARTDRIHAKGAECKKRFYTWPIYTRVVVPAQQFLERLTAYHFTNSIEGPHWVFVQQPLVFTFPIIAPPDSGYVWDTTVVVGDTVFSSGDTIVITSVDTLLVNGDTTVIVGGDTIFVEGGSAIVCDTSFVFDTVIVRDTAIVGGDTIVYYDTIIRRDTIISYDILLSVSEAGSLARLTGVVPNPAAETARVVSSFGLQRVEAFDLSGRKVDDIQLSEGSLSITLDISRWPQSTYILRIHTPMGVATKKLAVRR